MRIKTYVLLLLGFFTTIKAQEPQKISLQSASILEYDKEKNPGIQIVRGNVIFEHQGSLLFCDSALFYIQENLVKAKGNILLKINDSISARGDELTYDGNEKKAMLKGKEVELRDNNIRLLTKELTYDIPRHQAYYLTGGIIQDPQNTLKSKHGFYYTNRKEFFFRYHVQANGDNYILTSDSMLYNTKSAILYFFGKTHIIYDSTHLWFLRGWYNTNQHIAKAWDSAYLRRSSALLKADTIFYYDSIKTGVGFGNVFFQDSLEKAAFKANFARYRQQDSSLLLTDSALFIKWDKANDTLYLHADTIYAYKDSISTRQVKAYYNVRFYHPSFQGRCDSLHYSNADSLLHLYQLPIVWYENTQSSADTIQAFLGKEKLKHIRLLNKAFIHFPYRNNDYHQIKGVRADLFFENNELQTMLVNNDAELIYFIEDTTKGTAINHSRSHAMKIVFSADKNTIDKVIFYRQIEGNLYPYSELSEEKKKLSGFQHNEMLRPKSVHDLFIK